MSENVPRKYIIRKIESPCHHCQNRTIGCHSKCKAYDKFKVDLANEYERSESVYRKERLIEDHIIDRTEKFKNKKRKF